jgi:hypothetical protein
MSISCQVVEVCELLEKIKLSALAIHQKHLARDLDQQKALLLRLTLRVHSLQHVAPPVKTASVIAVVFGELPQESQDACGHSCLAVRGDVLVGSFDLMSFQALVGRSKDPSMMCALYDACMGEITRMSSSSSSSRTHDAERLQRDYSIGTRDASLPEAVRLWAHLQVTCDV